MTDLVLRPSASDRWINCPGSAQMEQDKPDTFSQYAQRGSELHAFAEQCLLGTTSPGRLLGESQVSRAEHDMLETYVEYVMELVGSSMLLVEQPVDFCEWVPGQNEGTLDAAGLHAKKKHADVFDFKSGAGVTVNAHQNPQLRIYALGLLRAWEHIYDFETVSLHIVQPAIHNISVEELTVKELYHWGDTILKPAAKLCRRPDAPLIPGPKQCRFCKARAVCRPLAEYHQTLALDGFEKINDPKRLQPNEIGDLLHRLPLMRSWATAVEEHALDLAHSGTAVAGWKVVEGRSNRRWQDEEAAEKALIAAGVNEVRTSKLISPSQALKTLGRNIPDEVDELIIKPPGKPTLAPQTDKRPPLHINPLEGFEKIE